MLLAREFCDGSLVCGEAAFRVHKAVLGGQSEVFRELLRGTNEVRLTEITHPEAVQLMVDFLYEVTDEAAYAPTSSDVNVDVLRLAEQFHLQGLKRRAAVFLARGVNTHN